MGKHRTARKYTGAVKQNINSGLGRTLQNTRKLDDRERRQRLRMDPGDYAEAMREMKFSGRSYVDDTDFAELVARAVAEGDEFTAKRNLKLLSDEEIKIKMTATATKEQAEYMNNQQNLLRIPRRPLWICTKKVDQEGYDWIEEKQVPPKENDDEYDSYFSKDENNGEEKYEDSKEINKEYNESTNEKDNEEQEESEEQEEGEEYDYILDGDDDDSIDWDAVAEELGLEGKRKKIYKWQKEEMEREQQEGKTAKIDAESKKNEDINAKIAEAMSTLKGKENKERNVSKKNKKIKGRARGMNPNRRKDVFQTAEARIKEAVGDVPERKNVGEPKIVSYIMTAEELKKKELESFCKWRKGIMSLENNKIVAITPFEKNIQMWRQLWHVVERSDIIIQVVDGRNPLLFRSADLVRYVNEVSITQQKIYNQITKRNQPPKRNLLILNKADLLPLQVRIMWSAYLTANKIEHVFFSALREEILLKVLDQLKKFNLLQPEEEKKLRLGETALSDILTKLKKVDILTTKRISDGMSGSKKYDNEYNQIDPENIETTKDKVQKEKELESVLKSINEDISIRSDDMGIPLPSKNFMYSPRIITRDQLLNLIQDLNQDITRDNNENKNDKITVVGTVGYPNVGKSSIINVLSIETGIRTTVSSTPGKTKHFQTINLNDKITLCDCPGLIFPSFTHTRADLVCAGILPIDHERDYFSPMRLLATRIPVRVFEKIYKITVPEPDKYTTTSIPTGVNKNERYATAEQIISAFCSQKGFNGLNGGADSSKAIRMIMKDLYGGKLLWLALPPPPSKQINSNNSN